MNSSTGSKFVKKQLKFRSHTYVTSLWFGWEVVHDENGMYNLTYICKKYGEPDIAYYKRNAYWRDFEDSLRSNKAYEQKLSLIYNISDNSNINEDDRWIAGSYYPEVYVGMLLMQIDKSFTIGIIENLIESKSKIDSIETKHKTLKKNYDNVNAGRRHDRPGSIIIRKYENGRYGIIYKYVNIERNNPRYKKDIVISNIYNIGDMKSLLYFYFNYIDLPFISKNKDGDNTFDINNMDKLEEFIYDVQQNKVDIKYDINSIIKHYLKSEPKRDWKFFGTMFEFYCSRTYEIPIYKYSKSEQLSLPKMDKGLDLLDVDNKILGQCKLYQGTKLENNRIETFVDFCECHDFHDWKKILFVSSSAELSPSIINNKSFIIEYIDDAEFQDFLNDYGIKPDGTIEVKKIDTCKTDDDSIADDIKKILDENQYIYFEDLQAYIYKTYNVELTKGKLLSLCDGYFYYNGRDALPTYEGKAIVRKIVDVNEYMKYFNETIGYGAYPKDEYFKELQEHFHDRYEEDWFSRQFKHLFETDNKGYVRKTVDKRPGVHVLMLKKDDRIDVYKEYFKENPNATCEEFNEHFHLYESRSGNFGKIKKLCTTDVDTDEVTIRNGKQSVTKIKQVEIHEYVEKILEDRTAILLKDLLVLVKRDVYEYADPDTIKFTCSDIIYKDSSAMYPRVDGEILIRRKVTDEEYKEYIDAKIGYSEVIKDDFTNEMYKHFVITENEKWLLQHFGYMFEKPGAEESKSNKRYRRRNKEGCTLTLIKPDRKQKYQEYFKEHPKATINDFNKHFHRFETAGTFKDILSWIADEK